MNPEEWTIWLQKRVMRLLLLHDRSLFRNQFHMFYTRSTLPVLPILQQYDRYIKLLALSDELLGDVLPRIRRQLSLQADAARLLETAPTRGMIDWQRTSQRALRELQGQAPLRFDTRLRQRSSVTVENLLTVAVLLALRSALDMLRSQGIDGYDLSEQEQLILSGLDERAARELVAPYARVLIEQARRSTVDTLVVQVRRQLRPGMSPYRDLVDWWQRFATLRIGRASDEHATTLASVRQDKKVWAWLYELWLALEFANFLYEQRGTYAEDTEVKRDILQFTFTWRERRFRFVYNRQSVESVGGDAFWKNAPGVRPDYKIERVEACEVRDGDTLIWREPPVLLDAKYYTGKTNAERLYDPVKKLLADMALLRVQQVLLFFPWLDQPTESYRGLVIEPHEARHYSGWPQVMQIHTYQLVPTIAEATLNACLREVLDLVVEHLPESREPRCEYAYLDSTQTNDDSFLPSPQHVLCLKRHIGPQVFDIVDVERDCLHNPQVCHVLHYNKPLEPPRRVQIVTYDDLMQRSEYLRRRGADRLVQMQIGDQQVQEEQEERITALVLDGIGQAIEQYVEHRGDTRFIEKYLEHSLFSDYWSHHAHSLSAQTRKMLISGEYVWDVCEKATLGDWTIALVQYLRALEYELRRRLYLPQRGSFRKIGQTQWTLAKLTYLHLHHSSNDDIHNWNVLCRRITDVGYTQQEFEQMVQQLVTEGIVKHRNSLSRGEMVSRQVAEALRAVILGSRQQPEILSWLAEHIDTD